MIFRRRSIERPVWPAGPPPILGLVGRKRAGKDTVAKRLVNEHGFVRMAFADLLKEALLALDPWVDMPDNVHPWRLSEALAGHGWEWAKGFPEVRRLLQNYGVAIREIDPDFWVRPVIWAARLEPRPVVITDVRFPNEAKAVEAHHGKLLRVTRPGLDTSDTHVSETALDERETWATVVNSGTVPDLWAAVDECLANDN